MREPDPEAQGKPDGRLSASDECTTNHAPRMLSRSTCPSTLKTCHSIAAVGVRVALDHEHRDRLLDVRSFREEQRSWRNACRHCLVRSCVATPAERAVAADQPM